MNAASKSGTVGGFAVALGIGLAMFTGAAEAAAESAVTGASAAEATGASAAEAAGPSAGPQRAPAHRVAHSPTARGLRTTLQAMPASVSNGQNPEGTSESAPTLDAVKVSTRTVEVRRSSARTGSRDTAGDVAAVLAVTPGGIAAPSAAVRAAAPSAAVADSAPSAAVRAAAPSAAVADSAREGSDPVGENPRVVVPQADPSWRDPSATVATPYGALGKWMLKDGKIADWVGLPYCGSGVDCGTLGQFKGKTVQEPINMVFVVPAKMKWVAEIKLDWSLRRAGFGPSPFSSIGYSGLVGGLVSQQMPRGGIFGFGLLPPLPFGLGGTRGLIPIASQPAIGVGAAYRNAPFTKANAHLRTFGGVPDGSGNYIFTASVSDEFLLTTNILGFIPNPIPTHGYESFIEARDSLTTAMLRTGGTDLGLVNMENQIADFFPRYTTGDHDGYAQVVGVGVSPAARALRSASAR